MNGESGQTTATPAASSSALPPGARLAHYEIKRLLGAGGMGEVYLAHDRRLRRLVALKLLPPALSSEPDRLERFRREARSAALLSHPNICTTHDSGCADGRFYISMEYVAGQNLRERLAAGPMPVGEALEVAIQIADALEEARQRGVVHRDVKSANIMLTAQSRAKLLDFGLARLLAGESQTASTELTRTGAVIGTWAYMSPEQVMGLPADHRSDLFSLGVVLYEMLTGRLPFGSRGPLPDCRAPKRASFNRYVPGELDRLVTKLLARRPEKRYATAAAVGANLARIRASLGATASVSRPVHDRRNCECRTANCARQKIRLLVLPLRNLTAARDREQEFFSEGLTEELIAQLTNCSPRLAVVVRPWLAPDPSAQGMSEIGRQAGADFLLDGSVRRCGSRLRVSVQLVDVAQQVYLCAHTHENELGDWLKAQKRAAADVLRCLALDSLPSGGLRCEASERAASAGGR
jgi:serine/threonine protein kinase